MYFFRSSFNIIPQTTATRLQADRNAIACGDPKYSHKNPTITAKKKPANLALISRNPVITVASYGKVISLAKFIVKGTAGIWKLARSKEIVYIHFTISV